MASNDKPGTPRAGTPNASASGSIDTSTPSPASDSAPELTDEQREAEREREQILAGGDVLVVNRRQGLTLGVTSRPDPNSPPGKTNYIVRQFSLVPGLQYVKPQDWLDFRDGWSERIASGEIAVVDMLTLRRPDMLAMVANSGHVPSLRKLLEHEKRDDVAKVLEKAIADSESGRSTLRGAQSAHAPR